MYVRSQKGYEGLNYAYIVRTAGEKLKVLIPTLYGWRVGTT